MLWRGYDCSNDDLVVEFTHVRVCLEKILFRLQIMSLKNVQITAERRGEGLRTATHHILMSGSPRYMQKSNIIPLRISTTFTVFKAPQCKTSVKGGAHTCSKDA